MKYSLLEDLEKRTNPEKTREFSKGFWLENLHILKKIYNEIKSIFFYHPLKISIIGTNGKGTTAYYLAQLFFYNDKNTGLYTSPHLISFTERISINLKNLSLIKLEKEYREFRKIIEYSKIDVSGLTYFEFLTIFSIYIFYKKNLKIHIYEAGLGGRLDATSIVEPDIVILITIRMDHSKILGNTYEKILREKLGIIKFSTKKLIIFDSRIKTYEGILEELQHQYPSLKIEYYNEKYNKNYIESLKDFSLFCYSLIEKSKIYIDKNNLKPPRGRREIYNINNQIFIYDVCHNPSGLYCLLDSLQNEFQNISTKNLVIFAGILPDRNYKFFIKIFKTKNIEIHKNNFYIIHKAEFIHHSIERNFILWNPSQIEEFQKFIQDKQFILFFGSFRIYEFFLNIINDYKQ